MKKSQGFTLIELMITVAVIAFLAAIAYPSYTSYIMRAKIAEATSALSDGRVKMEQYFQDNRTYIGGPAPAATSSFTYAVSNPGIPPSTPAAQTYTITATGVGSLAGYAFTIDQANAKGTTASPPSWSGTALPATCWITKKGGTC
jgi:type IV pilus assembly protein PilE